MNHFHPVPGSIFSRAKEVAGIIVELSAEDIQGLDPSLTADAAKRMIEQHGGLIARTMLCHGLSTAAQILQEEAHGN